MTVDLSAYRRRLAGLRRRAGGQDKATAATILAGQLRAAHRNAIGDRDRYAATLYRQHGWTATALCTAIYGRPNRVAKVREVVEQVAKPPKLSKAKAETTFTEAIAAAADLWQLYKEAKAVETEAQGEVTTITDEPALRLPADPKALVQVATSRLEEIEDQLPTVLDERTRGAAALVEHAGWAARNAAKLAGAAVRDVNAARAHAKPAEADPEQVAKLAAEGDALVAERRALVKARNEGMQALAKQGWKPADLARLAKVTPERAIQVRKAA